MRALLRADAFPGQALEGEVRQITPKGDPVNKTYRAYIGLPPDTPLMIGMTVEINVVVRTVEDAVLAPTRALSGDTIYVLRDGKAEARAVQTGVAGPERTQVLSGVEAGERAILDPSASLRDGARVRARNILVAVGARPSLEPAIPGGELGITSNEVFDLAEQPRRILVIGGGYIAVEFAGIFRGLGSEVTLVHRGDKLLRGFDEDIRDAIGDAYARGGVRLRLGRTVDRDGRIRARPGNAGAARRAARRQDQRPGQRARSERLHRALRRLSRRAWLRARLPACSRPRPCLPWAPSSRAPWRPRPP